MLNKAEFGNCSFHNKHCKPKVTVLSQERSSSVTQCLRVKGMVKVGGTIRAPKCTAKRGKGTKFLALINILSSHDNIFVSQNHDYFECTLGLPPR